MNLLDLLWPPYCQWCSSFIAERTVLCDQCCTLIKPVVALDIDFVTAYALRVHAVSTYDFPLKQLILAKQYSNRLAAQQLGHLMVKYVPFADIKPDYIVPVPQHWTRSLWRGYNQTAVMAHAIYLETGIPVAPIAKRVRRTHFQRSLNSQQRAENVKKAFKCVVSEHKRFQYAGSHLIIVDDLCTTGSTLKSLAQALLVLKPARISVVVACRVIDS
jgi:ComF family protein